jgi:hypothetical protein
VADGDDFFLNKSIKNISLNVSEDILKFIENSPKIFKNAPNLQKS